MQILLLIFGFVLLIKGADLFVEGASKFASKLHIPQIVIGLTIVAFGTSAPEAAISITSALNGSSDLSIGNIIGSNILNVLLILGITGCMVSLKVKWNTFRYEIPFVMFITLVLLILGKMGGSLNVVDGIVLWALFLVFLYYLYRLIKKGEEVALDEVEEVSEKDKIWKLVLYIIIGMGAIIWGSNITIASATSIATSMGINESIIALTVVSFGTSLPELITSVTAALKGNNDISVGNIIGSNIFNILFVLGATALISPTPVLFAPRFIIDGIIAIVALIVFYVCINKELYVRKSGALIMLLCYGAYFLYII